MEMWKYCVTNKEIIKKKIKNENMALGSTFFMFQPFAQNYFEDIIKYQMPFRSNIHVPTYLTYLSFREFNQL